MNLRSTLRLFRAAAQRWGDSDLSARRVPFKVNLLLTYECNSRCLNCRIWELYKRDPALKQGELTADELGKIVEGVADHAVWLTFSGGEPTQKEALADIVCQSLRVCRRLALMNFAVNGLAPETTYRQFETIARHSHGLPIFVTVSLDGLGEQNDEIRGVPGAYAAARDTFARLASLEAGYPGFRVFFQVTICNRNGRHAPDLLEFAREKGLAVVTLAQESSYYRNDGQGLALRVSDLDREELTDCLRRGARWWPPEAVAPHLYLLLASGFLREGRAPIPCSAGRASITVDPFGSVLPCCYLDRPLGNLRDHRYRMADLLESARADEIRRSVRGCRLCWHNCEALPSMLGHPISTLVAATKESIRAVRWIRQ